MKYKILYLISIITLTSNLFSDMRIYITGNTNIEHELKKNLKSTVIYFGEQGTDEDGQDSAFYTHGAKFGDNYIEIPKNYINFWDRSKKKVRLTRPIKSLQFGFIRVSNWLNQKYEYKDGIFKLVLYVPYEEVYKGIDRSSYHVGAFLVPYNPEEDKQQQEARAAAPARQEQQEQKEQVRKSENHPAARAQADDPVGGKAAKKINFREAEYEEYSKDPELAEAILASLKIGGPQSQQQQQMPK